MSSGADVKPRSHVGTKGVPRPDREAQILSAATAHFAEHGFAATAVADIAVRAGISKPLIYQYFGSKENLYRLCIDQIAVHVMRVVEPVSDNAPLNAQGIAESLAAVFRSIEENPRYWRLLHDTNLPPGPLRDAALIRRDHTALVAGSGAQRFLLAEGNVDEGDASMLTAVWVGTLNALIEWWIHHPDYTAAEMTDRAERIIEALFRSGTGLP